MRRTAIVRNATSISRTHQACAFATIPHYQRIHKAPDRASIAKVALGSEELSAALVAIRRAPPSKSRMDIKGIARLSLANVSAEAAPAPLPSRRRRRLQRRNPESQASSKLRPGDVITTVSEGPTERAATQPLGTLFTGNSQVYRHGSGTVFTPYQPLRYRSTSRGRTGSPTPASDMPRYKSRLPAPVPTLQYITQASRPSVRLQEPQKLLVILDLTGILLSRKRSARTYTARPSLDRFLSYCFEQHSVLVWSSATPAKVTALCGKLFSETQRQKLLGEWDRESLGLTPRQYRKYVQVYKRLDTVWASASLRYTHPDSEKGAVWDQSNTVLIDDNALKASAQPHNLVQIPEFTKDIPDPCDVLQETIAYLEQCRMFEDVSSFIRKTPLRLDLDGAAASRWKSGLGDMDVGATKQPVAPISS
ncbi:MAG: hypothetical protein FRX48_04402 [Lasallia pustulata]|uniref:Mitochondrial import inner membrane translocase subunit TIM50 n=1 Tax=Lasallia pustulata TaxID=136370 RepID=A0A5M8PTD1_9LECA|nr:MAG: hypothetical protein FRX48_04402 [Lasallia pustulata]